MGGTYYNYIETLVIRIYFQRGIFGLPVLEDVASNIPVVATDKMPLPEVAINAGILAKPDNIRQVAKRMYKMGTSKTPKFEKVVWNDREVLVRLNCLTNCDCKSRIMYDTYFKI